ncbi:MAG: hypothetical protein QM658_15675, partial [Gordonia sp. (in: high G+C Gram-positive bacteria)]
MSPAEMSPAGAVRRAWAYLAAVAEPPCAPVIALAEAVGPCEAAAMVAARRVPDGYPEVLEATQARFAAVDAAADLAAWGPARAPPRPPPPH